jgi:tRNA splicing ligase
MKGKDKFSASDAQKIRVLIEKKKYSSLGEQKYIRNEIRKLGFFIEDFTEKKGYSVEDFNRYVIVLG